MKEELPSNAIKPLGEVLAESSALSNSQSTTSASPSEADAADVDDE